MLQVVNNWMVKKLKYTKHHFSTSPSQPSAKIFQNQLVPSTPRNFQPVLSTIQSTIPPHSPSPFTTRPALVPTMRQLPLPQPRISPRVTSQQLQPVASSSRRREDQLPLPFLASKVSHQRE
ncbi:hypothetical protein O181_113255 [Austropuccinia psidii MF-1]|uniref:Uncharacterized protein n=1 Tax=Austropuccinia psidii MF-1 TaxID=1389203 RepID=A0A9Q3K249_9BASI|nr:hypothetical protein [Austropuccinia psidii MF-1]